MKPLIIIIIILLILYLIITYLMFVLISKKSKIISMPMSKVVFEALEPYKDIINKGNNWIKEKIDNKLVKDVYIKSFDNLNLHAIFIENKNSKGIIIECHGYRSMASRDLYPSCHEYYNMGYSLLITDNRACNKSEGKYITFGVNESKDIHSWIKYLNKEYPKKDIILGGISMGASSIMMALGEINKDMNVKCAIVDCGYISPYEEVLYCIKHYYHVNGNLFIKMIDIWCKIFAKFSLKEKDTISSLKNVKIPILFIHGLEDDFVPPFNSKENYKMYKGIKSLQLFENASHGTSYLVDHKKYIESIKDILSK